MTLIALVATSDYIVQVADRKLTGGGPRLTEQNKAIVVHLPNGVKLLVGYAGLANWAWKAMNQQIVFVFEKLLKKVGNDVDALFSGLAAALDERFALSDISGLTPQQRLFSISVAAIGVGARYSPLVKCVLVSNHRQIADEPVDVYVARGKFDARFYDLSPTDDIGKCVVLTIGEDDEFEQKTSEYLRLLADGKGAPYLRDRVVADVIAYNPRGRTVGDDVHSVVIDGDLSVQSDHHVARPTDRWSFIDQVFVQPDFNVVGVSGGQLTLGTDASKPEGIVRRPKQSKKSRCWCGSGKRYAQCHG